MSNSIFDWPASLKRFVRFTSAKAEGVNDALDDLSAGLDTVEADIKRAVKLPVGTADQTLALAAGQRAGLLLGFDPSGNIAGIAVGGRWRGDWSAATLYAIADYFRDPVSKSIYVCLEQHTSTSIAADLAANKVRVAIDVAEVENQRILAQQAATAAGQSSALSSQKAVESAASAATSATKASEASASAATASTKATEASSSATAAAGSASTASAKAGEAAGSATSAASSASTATAKATEASNSAAAAAGSATTATTKAGEASGSAAAAAASEVVAITKAGEASASAASAAGSASTATTKASEASASAIAASKLNLGDKATEPTVDNQGAALRAGATYYNTTTNKWRVWTGSAWDDGVSAGGNLVSKTGDKMAGPLEWATPVNVASAATTNIGAAAGNRVRITGTTTITSLGTIAAGACRTVTFAGALTLTHNATSLILPGGTNITTAAGDVAEFESLGAGNWRCTGYQKASGQAVSVSPLPNTLVKAVANSGVTSFTAWPGNHYLVWSVITVTLSASPTVGDTIYFTSHVTGWAIARNGNVISGVAEDLVVDIGGPGRSMRTFGLRFIEAGANIGWVII